MQCNTIWALTDFTEANGATRVMPGSQPLPDSFEHTVDETVPAEMPAGSVLLYTGRCTTAVAPTRPTDDATRDQHQLQRRLVAPGGEPVPVGTAATWPQRCPTSCSG